jgi:hypothetical protein
MATLRITSDGDPYPVKAGTNFVNDGVQQRLFPNETISDQIHDFSFVYRAGSNTKDPHIASTSIPIGITINGVTIMTAGSKVRTLEVNPNSAPSGFTWNEVAVPEDFVVDACGGRPDSDGQYTYRSGAFYSYGMMYEDVFLESSPYLNVAPHLYFGNDRMRYGSSYQADGGGDTYTGGHSKIVGYAFDGYPIYGPYGFSDPLDLNSPVIRMRSSYDLRDVPLQGRNFDYAEVTAGSFVEDYFYNEFSVEGTLDEFNGRYCYTPDYPTGTYAYFLTFEDSELQIPEYPYIIGPSTREQRTA